MGAPLPAGWPAPSDVEVLPTVYLETEADWPSGRVAVTSWSTERELVGPALPGNIRARSGLSIGDAQVTVPQPTTTPVHAPWGTGERQVTTGGRADLYAEHDHLPGVRVDLGDWLVDPTSGALNSGEITVELAEATYAGRSLTHTLPLPGVCDPVWVVDYLARQVGYYATPPNQASTVIAATMQGSTNPDTGTLAAVAGTAFDADLPGIADFAAADGVIALAGDGPTALSYQYPGTLASIEARLNTPGQALYVLATVTGTLQLRFGLEQPQATTPVVGRVQLELRPGGVLAIRNNPGGAWVTGPYEPGANPDQPDRAEVQVERLGVPGAWTGARARVRSSHDGPWSGWVQQNSTDTAAAGNMVTVHLADGATVAGFQVSTAPSTAGGWRPRTASLELLGGPLPAPWLPAPVDVWTAIQSVAGANLGAAVVTRDKIFTVRNRDTLAGVDTPAPVVDVGRHVYELGWSIDPADRAERLEVTYVPYAYEFSTYDDPANLPIVLYATPDVVEVRGGQTIEIVADVDVGATPMDRWVPAWDTTNLGKGNTWSAYPNRQGTGDHAPDNALTVTARTVNSGRHIISVRNNTSGTLYTVDATGQPCLILRTMAQVLYGTTATLERGAPPGDTVNTITVDLSYYVQRRDVADAIADYIFDRASTPLWKATGVRAKLDWAHDIGDIVTLHHARSELTARALVTKVAHDGQAGEVAQTLDLVLLLPTIWADFDQAWSVATWADFDDVWAGATWAEFDIRPDRTTA